MLEDYFTKPIKVKVLKLFRDVEMGLKPISSLKSTPFSIKAHVGNNGEMLRKIDPKSDVALLSN